MKRKRDYSKILTDYDKEIMVLLCQEKRMKDIGKTFNISPKAVHHQLVKIRGKIGCESTTGIVVYAVVNNIYQPEKESV